MTKPVFGLASWSRVTERESIFFKKSIISSFFAIFVCSFGIFKEYKMKKWLKCNLCWATNKIAGKIQRPKQTQNYSEWPFTDEVCQSAICFLQQNRRGTTWFANILVAKTLQLAKYSGHWNQNSQTLPKGRRPTSDYNANDEEEAPKVTIPKFNFRIQLFCYNRVNLLTNETETANCERRRKKCLLNRI